MKFSKLPAWADPEKALAVFRKAVSAGGIGAELKERVRALEAPGAERRFVRLPGFTLFDSGYPAAPYTWCVPKPKEGPDALLMGWEHCTRPTPRLGRLADPLRDVSRQQIFLSRRNFEMFFGPAREAADWFTPAAKVIAVAQHFEGQGALSVMIDPDPVSMQRSKVREIKLALGNCAMHLSRSETWSNLENKPVPAKHKPRDATLAELCIPPLTSNKALAIALVEMEDTPTTALQTANVVLRGLHMGLISPAQVAWESDENGPKALRVELDDDPMEIIAQPNEHTLRRLSDVLVPGYISGREFRSTFGDPYRTGRTPRPTTVAQWRQRLFELLG